MNRKEDTQEFNNAKVTLEEYQQKKKLNYGDRLYLVENENSKLTRNRFIDTAFEAGRISEYEFYKLGKQNTTNRLLKGLVLLALKDSDKNLEGWLLDLED
ncbi:unnamed protein product [marine sediment metagenome]|uniref:Uncharacterized protein n=1 Tax=marine sediment metagenome TaxID=412755 RepID=X1JR05_9ZZZZ